MFFNRKSTAFQQEIDSLEKRLKSCEDTIDRQLTQNKSDLLEFADLSSKMRRLYLRLVRISKIEPEESSEPLPDNHDEASPAESARAVRDEISRRLDI